MKASFVLVHGAFQNASSWNHVKRILEAAGHTVLTPELPGRNAENLPATPLTLEVYRDTVLPSVDAGSEPVVLVGHSFGGFTVTGTALARPQKIKRLVYLAAYVPADGENLTDLSGTDSETKFTQENFVLAPDFSYCEILERDRALLFANDVEGDEQAAIVASLLREPLSPPSQKIGIDAAAFATLPKAYIKTLRDNTVGPQLQQRMLERAGISDVYEVNAGHAAAMTQPQSVADALLSIAGQ